MGAYLIGVGASVPSRVVTNDELGERIDTSDEWIYSHTGIRRRHVADDNIAASDLAVVATQKALEQANLSSSDLDMILVATSTPDYPGLPATATIVQDRLGAEQAGAMDVVAACTGFVYALSTAAGFIASGTASKVAVIGTEVFSRILNWDDRGSCVLFGDGAGAAIVSDTRAPGGGGGVQASFLRSRGSGAQTLLRPVGGSRRPFEPGVTTIEETKLSMNGRKVYMFAIQAIVDSVEAVLSKTGRTIDDIDYVVPHQANARIIEAACKRGGYPIEKFFTNIEEYANTSAASIPIALDEMVTRGILTRGKTVITVGFGAGLTYGSNLIEW